MRRHLKSDLTKEKINSEELLSAASFGILLTETPGTLQTVLGLDTCDSCLAHTANAMYLRNTGPTAHVQHNELEVYFCPATPNRNLLAVSIDGRRGESDCSSS